jgi:hypothetical protein
MKEALQEIPSKKIGGVPENALLKAASLSDRNVEVTWLRNSTGKALLTKAVIDGHLITSDDNTRMITALFNEIGNLRDRLTQLEK